MKEHVIHLPAECGTTNLIYQNLNDPFFAAGMLAAIQIMAKKRAGQ